MREILFRGKRLDNGKWVVGSFLRRTNPCIEQFTFADDGVPEPYIYAVCPDTVGQYTGLTANGKRVFEGDILRKVITTNGEVVTGAVSYADGAFGVKSNRGGIFLAFFENCEIIGNIHDNPELLNKEDNGNGME